MSGWVERPWVRTMSAGTMTSMRCAERVEGRRPCGKPCAVLADGDHEWREPPPGHRLCHRVCADHLVPLEVASGMTGELETAADVRNEIIGAMATAWCEGLTWPHEITQGPDHFDVAFETGPQGYIVGSDGARNPFRGPGATFRVTVERVAEGPTKKGKAR